MKEFTKGNDTDFQVIDLHCDSHGAEYQKRSITYTISKLFQKGVSPKDIYVVVEWSQPNRLFIELPKEFCGEIEKDKNHLEGTFILNNKFERVDDSLEYIGKYKSLNVVFDDRVYANIEHSDLESFENKNIQFYIKEFIQNTPISNKPIDRLEQYLTNIVDLQNFLKTNQIQYSFFLMNNSFEGYYDNFLHKYGTDDIFNHIQTDVIKLPDLVNFYHIKDFSNYLTQMWNLLDLSNFCFYKTDKFNYGGIDEYSMEKFGHISYTSGANVWDIPEDGYCTSFGAHPHDSIYIDFFNEYIYNKIQPFIGQLEFDMTDRWNSKKHNAIRQ
jgi:hypothetical protein